jgi:hypothetical protein
MNVIDLSLTRLRNEEHFQFQTDFKKLVETGNPATLNIAEAFNAYVQVYNDESQALDVIRKSAISDDIVEADGVRDSIFRGFSDAILSASRHFNAGVKQAALRLQVVIEHYGNIARKPYDEETAAINSLVKDLRTTYTSDVTAISGLTEWITELAAKNDAFESLKKSRYTEESAKTLLRMKEVRVRADAAYHTITSRIHALMLINGEAGYTGFVNELNTRIDSYSKTLAQRKGRNANDDGAPDAPKA